MTDDGCTPSTGDGAGGTPDGAGQGGGRLLGRAAEWVREHGPQTLIGSVIVTVVGAVVTVTLTSLLGEGGGSGGGGGSGAESTRPPATATLEAVRPPTCSGETCDGLDPKTTGCGDRAVTLGEEWASTMHLEIRYSPACRTVWGKLTGAEVDDTVEIQTSPTRHQVAKVVTGTTKYTPMLRAPEDFTAKATAVAVNATAVRDVAKGHVLRVGAGAADLPSEPATTDAIATDSANATD
ncbi:DUF2690 domain-containing protein [Streptomyces sp. NPDC052043]|uniref:DUF2690 domain-containing protein n=1 Tax=Streptomyces sp. NPDC052043 TaxID=3365684 RepID=UPI0037D2DF76